MNETNVADGVKPLASGPMNVAPNIGLPTVNIEGIRVKTKWRFWQQEQWHSRGKWAIGTEDRESESEPKIFRRLLPLSIETVIPSSIGGAGITFHVGVWLVSFPASIGSDVGSRCTSMPADDCVFA